MEPQFYVCNRCAMRWTRMEPKMSAPPPRVCPQCMAGAEFQLRDQVQETAYMRGGAFRGLVDEVRKRVEAEVKMEDGKKVFVVFEGSGADRTAVAVFSSREKALVCEQKGSQHRGEHRSIEEFWLDPIETGRWIVRMEAVGKSVAISPDDSFGSVREDEVRTDSPQHAVFYIEAPNPAAAFQAALERARKWGLQIP